MTSRFCDVIPFALGGQGQIRTNLDGQHFGEIYAPRVGSMGRRARVW